MTAGDPNPEHQDNLAHAYNDLGGLYAHRSDFKSAEAAFQSALAIRKLLAEKYKGNDKYQKGLTVVQLNLCPSTGLKAALKMRRRATDRHLPSGSN